MSEFKLLAIALLLWGTSNLAANAGGGLDSYKYHIDHRVTDLNAAVPDLNLKERREPLDIPAALATLGDISKLENYLGGTADYPEESLITITCSRALCFHER